MTEQDQDNLLANIDTIRHIRNAVWNPAMERFLGEDRRVRGQVVNRDDLLVERDPFYEGDILIGEMAHHRFLIESHPDQQLILKLYPKESNSKQTDDKPPSVVASRVRSVIIDAPEHRVHFYLEDVWYKERYDHGSERHWNHAKLTVKGNKTGANFEMVEL